MELVIPATHRSIRVARLAASAAASHFDADVDAIEDLHLAVGEACGILLDCATPAPEQPDRLELSIRSHLGGMRVRAERPFANLVRPPSEISTAILDTVCDRWKLLRGPVVVLTWRPARAPT